MAGRENPVPKSCLHGCKVCLRSLPPSMQCLLELTHHWLCFPAKLGALALPVPCNILSWFLYTCFSLCNMRAVRHATRALWCLTHLHKMLWIHHEMLCKSSKHTINITTVLIVSEWSMSFSLSMNIILYYASMLYPRFLAVVGNAFLVYALS